MSTLAFHRTLVRRRVTVNLLSGRAFAGILWAQRGPLLVLRDVTIHERGARPVPVDGEVVVERPSIDFIQVTPG